jgi:hypothetical protein
MRTFREHFPGFDFWIPQGEGELARMSTGTLAGDSHQTWAYERAAQVWRFDVFREPDRIPYLRPEIVRSQA